MKTVISNVTDKSGTEVITYSDGSTKTTLADGTSTEVGANGQTVVPKTTTTIAGRKTTIDANGNIVSYLANGNIVTQYMNGNRTVTNADGTVLKTNSDGDIATVNTDGTTTTTNAFGKTIANAPVTVSTAPVYRTAINAQGQTIYTPVDTTTPLSTSAASLNPEGPQYGTSKTPVNATDYDTRNASDFNTRNQTGTVQTTDFSSQYPNSTGAITQATSTTPAYRTVVDASGQTVNIPLDMNNISTNQKKYWSNEKEIQKQNQRDIANGQPILADSRVTPSLTVQSQTTDGTSGDVTTTYTSGLVVVTKKTGELVGPTIAVVDTATKDNGDQVKTYANGVVVTTRPDKTVAVS